MRAREFIREEHRGKIPRRLSKPAKGLSTFNDGAGAANTDYTQYRVGLALACADGTTPLDVDSMSWHGKQKTAHPYTELEQKMLDQAYKAAGAEYFDHNTGENFKSRELDGVNTVSPVAQWNKKS